NGCVGDRRYSRIFRPSMTARSAPGSLTAGAPPSLCSLHSVRFTLFASLGVGAVMTGAGRAARKARRIEQREIERRLAVHQPLRDVASGRGRVLEAVASEADGQEEPLDAGGPADDGVIVGRQRPEPGPATGDAGL